MYNQGWNCPLVTLWPGMARASSRCFFQCVGVGISFEVLSVYFPTSLCGVLVFRFAPAAASARPSAAALPRLSLSHLTPHMALEPTHHTALSSHTNSHHTWLSHQLITQHSALTVWQAQYTEPSGGAAWPLLGRGWLSCGRSSTQSLLEELLPAWPPLGRGWLSCGRRKTQSLLEELLCAWPPLGRG